MSSGVKILRRWIGEVEAIRGDTAYTRLQDRDDEETDVFAEFRKNELSFGNPEWPYVGQLFYWDIGVITENGREIPHSDIRRRDDPPVTEQESIDARKWSEDLRRVIEEDNKS